MGFWGLGSRIWGLGFEGLPFIAAKSINILAAISSLSLSLKGLPPCDPSRCDPWLLALLRPFVEDDGVPFFPGELKADLPPARGQCRDEAKEAVLQIRV